jgi:hypothetical protein
MVNFLIYPSIGDDNSFPPEVNQAIADSPELAAKFVKGAEVTKTNYRVAQDASALEAKDDLLSENVVTSPNGSQFKLTVANDGVLTTSALSAPQVYDSATPKFGLSHPESALSHNLNTLARRLGEFPALLHIYADWTQPFPTTAVANIAAKGSRPVITWEPMVAGAGVTQPSYTLASIISGAHDAYIDQWITSIMAYSGPKLILRFAHEMNGNWYPWSEQVNGNSAGQYVQAWQHVVSRMNAQGVWEKADFLWCPNTPYTGSTPLAGLYPGTTFTTFAGLDCFNFGTTDAYSSWKTPWETIGPGLNAVRAVAPGKSIIITEIASVESEGANTKAAWITELIRSLHVDQGDVWAFLWFNERKFDELNLGQTAPTDWRLESSLASITAMKDALATRRS